MVLYPLVKGPLGGPSPEGQDKSTSNKRTTQQFTGQLKDRRDAIYKLPVSEYGCSGLLETLLWKGEILYSKDLPDLPFHGRAPGFAQKRHFGERFRNDPS